MCAKQINLSLPEGALAGCCRCGQQSPLTGLPVLTKPDPRMSVRESMFACTHVYDSACVCERQCVCERETVYRCVSVYECVST